MANRIPLFLLSAVALAAAVAYLLQSSKRDDGDRDDREHDLQLHDDGSDDVTVQVKNGRAHHVRLDSDDHDDARKEVAQVDMTSEETVADKMSVVEPVDKDTAGVDRSIKKLDEEPVEKEESAALKDTKSERQTEELIKQEAMTKAATIIQSMPAVSIVDECIQEVAAAALDTSNVEVNLDIREESAAASNISTIQEEPIKSEKQTEQYVPIKEEPATPKMKLPKTPPVSLFSPSPQKDEIEAPTDTADYSKLKNYWKHQDNKHTFSPPRGIDSEVLVASPMKPPAEVEGGKANLARSSSKEDNAGSAAVAGLMAAGVVNMLDQVYSPKGQVTSFADDEDEGIPLMDVSMVDDKSGTVETNVKEEDSDEQLILASDSPSSGSEKSSSDDYVKIVRTPSGDPISESALLSRPMETAEANYNDKRVEGMKSDVLAESAAVVSKEDVDVEVKALQPDTNEEIVQEAAGSLLEAEKPQAKLKSKNKKKKKGKKK